MPDIRQCERAGRLSLMAAFSTASADGPGYFPNARMISSRDEADLFPVRIDARQILGDALVALPARRCRRLRPAIAIFPSARAAPPRRTIRPEAGPWNGAQEGRTSISAQPVAATVNKPQSQSRNRRLLAQLMKETPSSRSQEQEVFSCPVSVFSEKSPTTAVVVD